MQFFVWAFLFQSKTCTGDTHTNSSTDSQSQAGKVKCPEL